LHKSLQVVREALSEFMIDIGAVAPNDGLKRERAVATGGVAADR
jgi:hypothetical protein